MRLRLRLQRTCESWRRIYIILYITRNKIKFRSWRLKLEIKESKIIYIFRESHDTSNDLSLISVCHSHVIVCPYKTQRRRPLAPVTGAADRKLSELVSYTWLSPVRLVTSSLTVVRDSVRVVRLRVTHSVRVIVIDIESGPESGLWRPEKSESGLPELRVRVTLWLTVSVSVTVTLTVKFK